MPTVELIYDPDCPNVGAARGQLLRAFAESRLEPRWREWRNDAADSPAHVRAYGSPTILVDGNDVSAADTTAGASCRLYPQTDGTASGIPSVQMIRAALDRSRAHPAPTSSGRGAWKLSLAMLPGIGAALLPKVACPACWPAYAGFLSSVGLGFLVDTTYLLPLTVLFLCIALFALGFRARRRRGYGPLGVGLIAAVIVLLGKFGFESDPAMYGGLGLLVAASLWNSWPRTWSAPTCAACSVAEETTIQPGR